MAAAMIADRGLRKKLTQEAMPEKPPRKPSKRKSTAGTSKAKKNEQNNNKKPKISTGDPKLDLFSTYQPWVIQTYGDLAKTKTITLKKYARILRTLRGEECNSSDSSKFRFWVKAKGFHVGKPPGYDAKAADGIVCRYSVADAEGSSRSPEGQEVYSGSQNDPPLYIPTPPLKVDNSLLEIPVSDDSDAVQDLSERKSPEKKNPRKRRSSARSNTPYVLNTPSPRPNTPFGLNQSAAATPFTILTPSTTTPFLNPPVGIATPLTPTSLATIYPLPSKQKKSNSEDSRNGDSLLDGPQDLSQHADQPNENEFEMFAKLIASQLRKLPLSLALDTQLKIQTLVNAARIQAVYQQYSYAGPSQETLSVQALSNGILTSIASQSSAFAARNVMGIRNDSPDEMGRDMKPEISGGSEAED